MQQLHEKLLMASARAAERRLSEFDAQNLPNPAWMFATVKQPDGKLFMVMASVAERRLSEFNVK